MILIIGGGVAGLSLGWQLAKSGAPVTVLEQAEIGSGASHAAAAYLEPRLGKGAMRRLEWAAVKLWPEYALELEEVTSLALDYRRDGQLRIAYEDNLEQVRADLRQRQKEGWCAEWLTGKDLHALEPNLSDAVVGATYLPDVDWLDGRKLCRALARAITLRGGTVSEHARVLKISSHAGRVTGVHLENDQIETSKLVVCAGMGTNEIAGLPQGIAKCRPVKGVMLGLAMDPAAPVVNRLIKRPDGILCPRSDGRLLVGVTHEEGETSLVAAEETVQALLQSAIRAVPVIVGLKLQEAACGIRSLAGDGLLRLGHSTTMDGLYYSLSHAGAGFIRAPAISAELAQFILDHKAACPSIDRFLAR
jgi:glycine oxidase